MNRYFYLDNLLNRNETLFFALTQKYLIEMLPIIYTPNIGNVVQQFSRSFNQARGLYFNDHQTKHIDQIMRQDNETNKRIMIITDGEGVLGIGDQGVGGMIIATAKAKVYTLCAGINPTLITPAFIDIGTNNEQKLDDPFYMGVNHPRIKQKDYDQYMDQWIKKLKKNYPHIYLHWEDFGVNNARRFLNKYRDQLCTFNDDIQGTGAVTLATLLAATQSIGSTLPEQRIVLFGAGTAGIGIIEQINQAMKKMGLKNSEKQFWCLDRSGLLTTQSPNLNPGQKPFAREEIESKDWPRDAMGQINLVTTIEQIKPTVLIGCSTCHGAFNESAIKTMYQHTHRPIIMPLSNPTENAEATPKDLIQWTNGQALIATGSPFAPVTYRNNTYAIPQCNNAYIFPGIGLGALISKAKFVSDNMIWAACQALSECAPLSPSGQIESLLPSLTACKQVSRKVALAVANQAIEDNLSAKKSKVGTPLDLEYELNQCLWEPKYHPIKLIK